jgi:hypothetical protein
MKQGNQEGHVDTMEGQGNRNREHRNKPQRGIHLDGTKNKEIQRLIETRSSSSMFAVLDSD